MNQGRMKRTRGEMDPCFDVEETQDPKRVSENMKSVTDYFLRKTDGDWEQYKSVSAAYTATKIPRKKLTQLFLGTETFTGYEFRMEKRMRPMTSAEIWKEHNKQRIGDYNKTFRENKKSTKKTMIYAQKVGDTSGEWLEFATAAAASKELGVHTANISKQLKGGLKQTGGYVFKKESIDTEPEIKTNWKDVCAEKGYENKSIGKPSPHRILHTEQDGVMGKPCSTCKKWKSLTSYNTLSSHWDGLRNDCKECLAQYRRDNKERSTEYNKKY
jgi:hypothetical protein